jgi:uncharacterized protein YkvS
MVDEIEKTRGSDGFEPNRYHETSSISEVNLVYHFAKQLEKKTDKCAVYLEFPCNSGRVDALILYENNILLVEAKTKIDDKKYKILNAQATRFENKKDDLKLAENEIEEREEYLRKYFRDSSLRDTLEGRVYRFMKEEWGIDGEINLYGLLLSDSLSKYQKDKWSHKANPEHYEVCKLDTMRNYKIIETEERTSDKNKIWYMGSYFEIGLL